MRILPAIAAAFLAAGCQFLPWADQRPEPPEGALPYTLTFDGNRSIGENALLRAAKPDLERFVENGYKKAAVDDAAWAMHQHYLGAGHPFASVTYEYEPTPGAPPEVRIVIDEGPRAVIRTVHFRGATFFDRKALHGAVQTPRTGWFDTGDRLYVESRLTSSAERLADAYYENGFLDVEVELEEPVFDEDRREVEVVFVVREGVRSTIHAIELAEGTADADQLRASLQRFLGQAYFPRMAFQVRAAVVEHFARRGYPDVDVEVVARPTGSDGRVHLDVTTDPGQFVRIGQVLVVGNDETRESFIRSRLAFREGEPFDRDKERQSFRALYRSGLFRAVRIETVGDGEVRDVRVEVQELPSLEIYGEPGYGSYERLRFRAGITERDLFGTGRRGKLEGLVSEKAREVVGTLTDPWLFDSELIGDLSLFAKERDEPSFTSVNLGGQALVTREWGRKYSVSTGYEYRRSDARDVKVGAPGTEGLDEDVNLSIVSLAATYDERDSVFLPRTGRYARALFEVSDQNIASDLDFVRISASVSEYLPLSENTGFVFSLRTGFAIPYGDTVTLPLQERFFNGGANSVRSFRQSELGPKDPQGNPIGGETSSTATVELRYPIWKSFEGTLFVDAGNVNLTLDDYGDFRNLRYGVGPGIRWLLPIGPVRLDWGINPNPRVGESNSVLHFSIGSSF